MEFQLLINVKGEVVFEGVCRGKRKGQQGAMKKKKKKGKGVVIFWCCCCFISVLVKKRVRTRASFVRKKGSKGKQSKSIFADIVFHSMRGRRRLKKGDIVLSKGDSCKCCCYCCCCLSGVVFGATFFGGICQRGRNRGD